MIVRSRRGVLVGPVPHEDAVGVWPFTRCMKVEFAALALVVTIPYRAVRDSMGVLAKEGEEHQWNSRIHRAGDSFSAI